MTIKSKSELRVLLLQIRDQQHVRQEEHESFALFSGLDSSQIDVLNVFDTPTFDVDVIDGYDALLVGGASEASVLEPDVYPFIEPGIRLLQHCEKISLPVFASCFGFQLAVLAFGGEIVRDKENFEMGTIPLSLTAEAADDLLLGDISDGFLGVSVHKERASVLPETSRLLAFTESCPHIIRMGDKPFWAFQFHPELDLATLKERLTIFKAHYTAGDGHLDNVLASLQETPESNGLVGRFIDRALLGKTLPSV
jgi:GMP synthase (glutamine-hydrolysing)